MYCDNPNADLLPTDLDKLEGKAPLPSQGLTTGILPTFDSCVRKPTTKSHWCRVCVCVARAPSSGEGVVYAGFVVVCDDAVAGDDEAGQLG